MANWHKLKQIVDCRDIVRAALGEPTHTNSEYDLYRSPFRDDHKPSFAVYKDGYKDFGTGDRGDAVDFLSRHYRVTFYAALEMISTDHAPNLPALRTSQRSEPPSLTAKAEPPSLDRWERLLYVARKNLYSVDGLRALKWLYKRGLTDDTIRAAGLGLLKQGITIEWREGLKLTAINVRLKTNDHPRYSFFGGSQVAGNLFNADTIRGAKAVLFCEGELDTLLAQQTLVRANLSDCACVSIGSASQSIAPRWVDAIGSREVLIALDNDQSGIDCVDRLRAALPNAKVITLPHDKGKDITEYISLGGDFVQLVKAVING